MTKADLIRRIAESCDKPMSLVDDVLTATFSAIADTVAEGEKVQLKGFGTFELVDRPSRVARNPQTGEAVQVPAKKVAKAKLTFLKH